MSTLRMSYDYDVIIVGCGVGGHGAALHARANGLKTAVLTGKDVGGTCVNRGCVPSKALLAAAGRIREMKVLRFATCSYLRMIESPIRTLNI